MDTPRRQAQLNQDMSFEVNKEPQRQHNTTQHSTTHRPRILGSLSHFPVLRVLERITDFFVQTCWRLQDAGEVLRSSPVYQGECDTSLSKPCERASNMHPSHFSVVCVALNFSPPRRANDARVDCSNPRGDSHRHFKPPRIASESQSARDFSTGLAIGIHRTREDPREKDSSGTCRPDADVQTPLSLLPYPLFS